MTLQCHCYEVNFLTFVFKCPPLQKKIQNAPILSGRQIMQLKSGIGRTQTYVLLAFFSAKPLLTLHGVLTVFKSLIKRSQIK